MPQIKLNEKCVALIKHFADHREMNARQIHAEVSLSHDISYRTVAECLVEYRRRGGQISPKRGKTKK